MWYKQPIRPMDPVVAYDEPLQSFRYIRDSFGGAGQYSQAHAPATPQDQFVALTNVMPPVRGVFEKRWGYAPFISSLGYVPDHLDVYANESTNPPSRKIISLAASAIGAFNEDGSTYRTSIYTPSSAPLMAYSRSTAYFFDGVSASQKWNGAAVGGVSLTGIDIHNATGTTSNVNVNTSPTAEGSYTDAGGSYAWSAGSTATFTYNTTDGVFLTTNNVNATNFGFALPGGATVKKVTAKVTYNYSDMDGSSGDLNCIMYVQLLKAGVLYGSYQSFAMVRGTGQVATGYWDLGALGLSLSDTDVADSNFGIAAWCDLFWSDPGNDRAWRKTVALTNGAVLITLNYDATTTANSITISGTAAGSIDLTSGRTYYVVFRNSTTSHMSDLSDPSISTGPLTAKEVNLTGIPQSLDPQVDVKWLLATADGGDGTLLYFLAELPNATGSYTDNTPELTLLANNIVQETDANGNDIGVADNTPPPTAGYYPTKHQGRLFLARNGTLYCSKNLGELTTSTGLICGRYEEAWPATYQFDISDDAEIINALLSDGTTLYACTNRHIRRVTGDSPADFQLTQIALNEAGVANHEAISIMYSAGTPAGAVWFTPDSRVLQSDFNTYEDIGAPIQDVLSTCNNPLNTRVVFYSDGPYDLVAVALTTGVNLTSSADTWCVFDARAKTWVVWKLYDTTRAMLFVITQSGEPLWLFADSTNNIHKLDSSYTTDNGTGITSTVKTAFLHCGTPTARKYLNELELSTTDPGILVTVTGANTGANFESPVVLASNVTPVVSPLGPLKVFLSHVKAQHRYFQFTFVSSATLTGPMLESYNLEGVPLHQL